MKHYNIHIVPHTHWDREWYLSFEHFRMRLVRMMDRLIEILDNESGYTSFNLDGQSIVLEDYLEIKPFQKERLKKFIQEGRIKTGPWYVQPDEFLISGESFFRNLALGINTAESFGGSMKVAYLPDMFGHISQLPQIFSHFGINQALLWRGLSGLEVHNQSEFYWTGASEDCKMFVHRFHHFHGYGMVHRLYDDGKKAYRQVKPIIENDLIPASTSNHLLLMVGVDHIEPQKELTRIISELNKMYPQWTFIHSTLEQFMESVRQNNGSYKKIQGELRKVNRVSGGRFNYLLPNVLSSRVHLKQWNTKCQYELERWAEPLSTINELAANGHYEQQFLEHSWKMLIQNHPHDSICGCSIDDVHRQMLSRFESSYAISSQLTDESLHELLYQVNVGHSRENEIVFHVFNNLAKKRDGTFDIVLKIPVAAANEKQLDVYDEDGRRVDCQIKSIQDKYEIYNMKSDIIRNASMITDGIPLEEKGIHCQDERFTEMKACLNASLPAMGYRTFTARLSEKPDDGSKNNILVAPNVMENEFIKVTVRYDGTIDVLNKEDGSELEGIHYFEDSGDVGDGYTYSPPLNDRIYTTRNLPCELEIIESGPLSSTLQIQWNWKLPIQKSDDGTKRSEELKACFVQSRIRLKEQARDIEVETVIDNQVGDHRIRVLFPADIKTEYSYAAGTFDVLKRKISLQQPATETWIEDAPGIFPNHGWFAVQNGKQGLAILPYGLYESEVIDDQRRTMALTLLRGTGVLGSDKTLTRSTEALPAAETPEGQVKGVHFFQYAISPFMGNWEDAKIAQRALEHHQRPKTVQLKDHNGNLPLKKSFFCVDHDHIQVSAFKRTNKTKRPMMRLYNPTEGTATFNIDWFKNVEKVYRLNGLEDRVGTLQSTGHKIPLKLKPKEIMAIEIKA